MKKIFLAVLLALSLTSAHADSKDVEQKPEDADKKIENLAFDIGLTPEQKTKIQASRQKYKKLITEKETAYNEAKDKFSAGLLNSNTTKSQLNSLYKHQENARRDLSDAIFQSRMEFRETLTLDQRSKMIMSQDDAKSRAKNNQPAVTAPLTPVPPPPPVIKNNP